MEHPGTGILRAVKAFFSAGIREEHDLEVRLRIRVIHIISVVTIAITTLFGLEALQRGRTATGVFDLCVGAVFLATQFYLRRTGDYSRVKYFWVVSTALLFLYLFHTGGIDGTGHLWGYIFPLVAAFLLGTRQGGVALVLFLAALLAWWGIDQARGGAVYGPELVVRFVVSFAIIAFSACYYEHFRSETFQQLAESNRERDRQIDRLKAAEGALRKQQEELERRVAERTQALQAANKELQREVVEHLKTGDRLRASEAQYRLLFEHSFDVILHLDEQFRLVSLSPSVERILGYRPEDLAGRNLAALNLLSPGFAEKAFRQIAEVFGGASISASDYEVVARDGGVRIAQISGAPIRQQGRVVGMIAIARDITVQKRAEEMLRRDHEALERRVRERTEELQRTNEALEKASRAKSDFLAAMSHELRTPLNHIMGFTELIADRAFGEINPLQEEHLRDVLQSSQHLLSLINDVLDLAKVEAGKVSLEAGEVALRPLLEESLSRMGPQAAKRRIRLQAEIDLPDRTLRADERKLRQVVYNLLANALKFTPDGGDVLLSARGLIRRAGQWVPPEGPPGPLPGEVAGGVSAVAWVKVTVRDTGIGIQATDLERIFRPFEQIDQVLSRRYQGTGLGLSLCRGLVELHGGRIWAESDGEGKGSRFSFVIPV